MHSTAAHFVVDAHDGDQNGVRGDGAFNLLFCNIAGFVRLQANDLKALCLQLVGGLYNALVLYGGGHNALAPSPVGIGCTEQSQVVGLCAAGGEKHPVRLRAEGGGDRLRAAGYDLQSLAIIESAQPGNIVFRGED